MDTTTQLVDLELAKRTLFRLPDDAQQVTVRAGTLWITQGNDPRDIILEAGQSFTPDGHRKVVLYALAPAAFTMRSVARRHAPARRPQRVHAAPGLLLE